MKLTIIGPDFFSYTDSIASELRNMGINVRNFDERGSSSFLVKAIFRSTLLQRIFNKVIKRRHDKIFKNVIEFSSTHALFISPDSLDTKLVRRLEKYGIVVALYMWDSLKNKPNTIKLVNNIKRKASFDPTDAKTYGLRYINLFAQPDFFCQEKDHQERIHDLTFVGTAHSNRPTMLKGLMRNSSRKNLSTKIHLFSGNLFYEIIAKLRLLDNLSLKLESNMIKKSECAHIFKTSKYIIDITHKHQKGLTCRSFEALAAGCYLITNNQLAHHLLTHFSNRIIIYKKLSNIDFNLLDWKKPNISDPKLEEFSLNSFCRKIMALLDE